MADFARVAVGIALKQQFDYRVPEPLVGTVQPGMRVLVPFGPRLTTGYVTALLEATDFTGHIRDISEVLDVSPAFNDHLVDLLRFAADYYCVPLGELMRKALPPSMHASERARIKITPAGKIALDEGRRSELQPFATPRGLTLKRAREILSLHLLDGTIAQGLLERVSGVESGGPGGILQRRVRVARFQPDLITGPKQKELVQFLLDNGTVAVSDLKSHFTQPDRLIRLLVERGVLDLEEVRVFRELDHETVPPPPPVELNADQASALAPIREALTARAFAPFLLHGITGSGKTELYMHAIAHALTLGVEALVLVPEIALTPQLMATFRGRFGDAVAILHSALSPGERYDQWCQVAAGKRPIVVGARSAIFAPLQRLGLLVVDEEHEPSFKQDDRPFYNARDLALVRAKQLHATVILGSATPSLESYQNALSGKYRLLSLPRRATPRPLPDVTLVDLREAGFVDEERVYSRPLVKALQERLARGEQSILFLNRKGFAAFQLCQTCGAVPRCPRCDISLTLYKNAALARCHYCHFASPATLECPTCGAGELQDIGTGTERAAELLQGLFPAARIARLDSTTTGGKRLSGTLSAFRNRELDMLVGTQIVAKGHDFPGVTLVGVILADLGLAFPDFRAAERTFQLLTQVAGRAGRGTIPGQVFIQTYLPQHAALVHAQRHDFLGFAKAELVQRQYRRYPPFGALALVRFNGPELERVKAAAATAHQLLQPLLGRFDVELLGPGMAPIQYLRGRYRCQLLIRTGSKGQLQRLLRRAGPIWGKALPRSTALRWDIDVDPANLM